MGYISNSSSSSFVLLGTKVNIDDLNLDFLNSNEIVGIGKKLYFDQDDPLITVLYIITHLLLVVTIGMTLYIIYCAVMGIPIQGGSGGGIIYIGDSPIIF